MSQPTTLADKGVGSPRFIREFAATHAQIIDEVIIPPAPDRRVEVAEEPGPDTITLDAQTASGRLSQLARAMRDIGECILTAEGAAWIAQEIERIRDHTRVLEAQVMTGVRAIPHLGSIR